MTKDKNKNKQTMTEAELNKLAIKIVSRMMNIQTMTDWFQHVNESPAATEMDYLDLDMTEEEDAISEAAKLMTLMNLFQENEEYEKCAIVKRRMDALNKVLNKGKR